MIKRVAAIQISDGTLFLDPDEAKRAEFAIGLQAMLESIHTTADTDPDVPFTVVDLSVLIEHMEDLRKVLDHANNIIVGAPAL